MFFAALLFFSSFQINAEHKEEYLEKYDSDEKLTREAEEALEKRYKFAFVVEICDSKYKNFQYQEFEAFKYITEGENYRSFSQKRIISGLDDQNDLLIRFNDSLEYFWKDPFESCPMEIGVKSKHKVLECKIDGKTAYTAHAICLSLRTGS